MRDVFAIQFSHERHNCRHPVLRRPSSRRRPFKPKSILGSPLCSSLILLAAGPTALAEAFEIGLVTLFRLSVLEASRGFRFLVWNRTIQYVGVNKSFLLFHAPFYFENKNSPGIDRVKRVRPDTNGRSEGRAEFLKKIFVLLSRMYCLYFFCLARTLNIYNPKSRELF